MVVRTNFFVYDDCFLRVDKYVADNSVYVGIVSRTDGPVATITTCLCDDDIAENESYLDINNCPWAVDFVTENELGEMTDDWMCSGFCVYPKVVWDLEKVGECK